MVNNVFRKLTQRKSIFFPRGTNKKKYMVLNCLETDYYYFKVHIGL